MKPICITCKADCHNAGTTSRIVDCSQYKPGRVLTNADRIRAMSDTGLAKLFYSVYKRSCIDFVNQSGINAEIKFENSEDSEAVFLKYLQSPAEEDT